MGRLFYLPELSWSVLQLAKPLMSKSSWEKLVVCTASRPWGAADICRCPFVAESCTLATLATFLGGACDCEGGCVGGFPNELSKRGDR